MKDPERKVRLHKKLWKLRDATESYMGLSIQNDLKKKKREEEKNCWYGMVYLFFHRQYKVISKQIANEMLPYTVNGRRPPYKPKVVLPQLIISLNIIH